MGPLADGVVVIKRVRLRNFISHEETEVGFGRGVTAIVGPNGAGKSSIVDAIYYALTLEPRGIRGSKDDLIRWRAGSAEVVLELAAGGKAITVSSRISRRQAESHAILKADGEIVASGFEGVRSAIGGSMGLTFGRLKTLLQSSVIVRQGGLDSIVSRLSGGERERKDLLSDIIGLADYEKAYENMKEYGVPVDTPHGGRVVYFAKQRGSMGYEELLREKERAERRLAELASRLPAMKRRLEEVSRELGEVESEKSSLAAEKARLEGLVSEYRSVEDMLARLREEASRKESRIREYSERLGEVEGRLRRLEPLARLRGLRRLVGEIDRLVMERLEAERRLAEIEGALRPFEEMERHREGARLYREYSSELESLTAKRGELEARRESLRAALEQVKRGLEAAASGLRGLGLDLGPAAATGLGVRKALESLERLRAELEEARKSLDGLESLVKELEAEASLASRMRSEALRKSVCPVCGRLLDARHRERVASMLERRRSEALQHLSEARSRLGSLSSRVKGIEEAVRILEGLESAVRSLEEAHGASIDSILREHEAVSKELGEIASRVEELSSLVKSYEADYAAYTAAAKRAGGASVEEARRLREEYEELSRRLGSLGESIRELESRLVSESGARSPEEARSMVEKADEVWGEYQGLRAEADSLRDSIRALEEERSRLLGEASRLESRLSELRGAIEEYRGLEGRLRSLEERESALRVELGELRNEVGRVEEEASRYRRYVEDLARASRKLGVAIKVREAFQRAPGAILGAAVSGLEREMSRIVSSFNLQYTGVLVDRRSLEISLVGNRGQQVSLSQLSGGERTVVALAFVLAVNSLLASRVGFLILDEPTGELDESNRRILVDVIRELGYRGEVPQLIIISHNEDVVDAADSVVRVRNVNGVSRVSHNG